MFVEAMMKALSLTPLLSSSPLVFNTEWLNELFAQANRVWVGFSGGIDSHVLLHAVANQISLAQKSKLFVIHIHHGLSANADDWLMHCESICQQLDVRFVAERVVLATQSSIEDAARSARYQAFQKVMVEQDVILLAHHAADQVETVLFRLFRGTGGKGLAGMPQERRLGNSNTRLIRPLLFASKEEIKNYAQQQSLNWIEDESNADEGFTRNFLRHSLVPVIQQRFPKIEQSIASSAQRIATDYAMLSHFAHQQLSEWINESGGLDLSYIADKALDERLFWLRHFLQGKAISLPHAQLESIAEMFAGDEDRQPEFVFTNGRIMRHQNALYLLPLDQAVVLAPLVSGEVLKRPFDEICLHGSDDCELKERPQGARLRMPNGKTRKLKKWLNDQQIPNWWREHLPYVFLGDELIAIGTLWRHPDCGHLQIEWRPLDLLLP